MIKLDTLTDLSDSEIQSVIAHAEGLLKQRDIARKEQALADARALLAAVGLSLKDLARKPSGVKPKGLVYRSGHRYQHPANKTLVWPGKGKKPAWLSTLESEGGKPVELAADTY